MGDIGKDWDRCGNTPYYRSGWGLNWIYVDPFNWQMISSVMGKAGNLGEGSMAVTYQKAPRYDFDEAKYGVDLFSYDSQEQDLMLRALHEWFTDLNVANSAKMKDIDIKKLFQNAPKETQSYVLNGIRGMFAAYEDDDTTKEGDPNLETKVILVVTKHSKAEKNLEAIESSYEDERVLTLVEDSIYEGLEKALSEFGIYEC